MFALTNEASFAFPNNPSMRPMTILTHQRVIIFRILSKKYGMLVYKSSGKPFRWRLASPCLPRRMTD